VNDPKKPTMPSDSELWREVEKQLQVREKMKAIHPNIPSREEIFESRKKVHEQAVVRYEIEQQEAIEHAEADRQYLDERRQQGKPVYSREELMTQYPTVPRLKESPLTVKEVQELGDVLQHLTTASQISVKWERVQALSRKLLFTYLSQAYGLYLRMRKSEFADKNFLHVRSLLWHKLKIETHDDAPPASHLLKLILKDSLDKTIHLYARSFQLAEAYEVPEERYTEFVKEYGGLEKIRKAWATVLAADKGRLPHYVRAIEESASLQTMVRFDAIAEIQLQPKAASRFANDILNQWCLVLAHVDPLDQISLIRQIPNSKALEREILKTITAHAKRYKSKVWEEQRVQAQKRSLDNEISRLQKKSAKEQAKAAETAATKSPTANTP